MLCIAGVVSPIGNPLANVPRTEFASHCNVTNRCCDRSAIMIGAVQSRNRLLKRVGASSV